MKHRLADAAWLARFRLRARLDRLLGVRIGPAGPGEYGGDGEDPAAALALPRTIWIYWAQGWDDAPPLVAACRRSWIDRNPGWTIVPLDAATVARHVKITAAIQGKSLSTNHLSNLIRLHLLAEHGGLWVDATTFCSRPLDQWLPPLVRGGFFAFSRPGRDRLVSNWFLAARPGHPLVTGWLERSIRYWRLVEKADFYFWCHYLFAEACRSDGEFRACWARMAGISADGPHLVLNNALRTEGVDDILAGIEAAAMPVHKLSWRLPFPPAQPRTPLGVLLQSG